MKHTLRIPEDHAAGLVPRSEIDRRITNLQEKLGIAGLESVCLTHGTDLFYFCGTSQIGVLVIPAAGSPVLFAAKSFERAAAESPLDDIRPMPRFADLIREIKGDSGARAKFGLTLDVLPAALYKRYAEVLTENALVDVSGIIRTLRMIKSDWEIKQIRKAAKQAEDVFGSIKDLFRTGMSELELSVEIERKLRLDGHPGMVRVRKPGQEFAILVVASGPAASYPSHLDGPIGFTSVAPSAPAGAGRRKIAAGETVMADIVTYYNGYQADHARTYAAGEAHKKVISAHEFCRKVLREIEARLRPGAICGDVYSEVARLAEEWGEPEGFMGYGSNRVKFFGHGVALELDEWPILAAGFKTALAPGMVLAVEPKAFSPTHGPAGLENTYLITENGADSLCDSEEDLIDLGK